MNEILKILKRKCLLKSGIIVFFHNGMENNFNQFFFSITFKRCD